MPAATSVTTPTTTSTPALVIGHITVRDELRWVEYRDQVASTLAPFAGEVLFRGRTARVLGGTHTSDLTVAIRFPDLAAAHAWFESPAYQRLIPLRMAAADVSLVSFTS